MEVCSTIHVTLVTSVLHTNISFLCCGMRNIFRAGEQRLAQAPRSGQSNGIPMSKGREPVSQVRPAFSGWIPKRLHGRRLCRTYLCENVLPLPSTFRFVLFSITVNHGNALFLFFRSQMDFVLVWCGAERFCNAAVFYASPRVNSVVKVTIAAIKQSSRSSVHRTTALCYNSCFMWSLLLYLWNLFYFIV